MGVESRSCNFPVWAISYFVNCDASGLKKSEAKQVDDFLERIAEEGYDISDYLLPDNIDSAKSFCANPDFGQPCECVDLTFYKHQ